MVALPVPLPLALIFSISKRPSRACVLFLSESISVSLEETCAVGADLLSVDFPSPFSIPTDSGSHHIDPILGTSCTPFPLLLMSRASYYIFPPNVFKSCIIL